MEIGGKGFALCHNVIWIALLLIIDSVWDGKAHLVSAHFALTVFCPHASMQKVGPTKQFL